MPSQQIEFAEPRYERTTIARYRVALVCEEGASYDQPKSRFLTRRSRNL